MKCTGKNCPLGFGKVEKCTVHNCEDRTKPKTNFDLITEDVETFVNWIYKHYQCMPEDVPCPMEDNTTCNEINCKKCFKEWLQKECKVLRIEREK